MFERIDHIGVAVTDLEPAISLLSGTFGMPVVHREVVEAQGVEAVLLDIGESHVELLAPLSDETPVGRFLARSGPGLHHVAYAVPDVDAALAKLSDDGVRLIDKTARIGLRGSRVAFLHPVACNGVLTELVQAAEGH